MPAAIVDGNDVLAVRGAVAERRRARARGRRPDVRGVQDGALGAALRLLGRRRATRASSDGPGSGSTRSRASASRSSRGAWRRRRSSTRPTRSAATEMREVREAAEQAPVPVARIGVRGRLRPVHVPHRLACPAADAALSARAPACARPGEHARGGGARRRRHVLGVARPLRPSGREPGDEREGDGGGGRARLPAGHSRPEPAPPRDAQRRLRRRRHLEPAPRRDRRRRRVDAAHERLLDAAHELARRPAPRGRAHRAAVAPARRRPRHLGARRDAIPRRSAGWPSSTSRSSCSTAT